MSQFLVANQPLSLATRHSLGGPLPRQLTDATHPSQLAKILRAPFIAEATNAVLAKVSSGYPPLIGKLDKHYSPVRR